MPSTYPPRFDSHAQSDDRSEDDRLNYEPTLYQGVNANVPKAGSELRTSIRNNNAGHSVQLNDLRKVQLSIVGWSVCRMYGNEMR